MDRLELAPAILRHFPGKDAFEQILALEGEVYRHFANRRTLRVALGDHGYFVKIHGGVGWKEIAKNLLSLRFPVVSAANEWLAIHRMQELGVATLTIAGYGVRGWNPAARESFLITDELMGTVSLEDYCRDWQEAPPPPALKRALIAQVAGIARRLHENGVNHRDFYLCHLHLQTASVERFRADPGQPLVIHVIDLHRTQVRARTPRRWRDKDLVGLYFSAMDAGLSRRDLSRFVRHYRSGSENFLYERRYWHRIHRRACDLYRKIHGRRAPLLELYQ